MSEDEFDEAGYRQALIDGGIAPSDAAQTARATALARRESAKVSPLDEKAYAASLLASGVDPEAAIKQARIAAGRAAQQEGMKRMKNSPPAQPGLFADDIPPTKIILTVPFKDKDAAKAEGALWDKETKQWYAPAGADMTLLTKWIPKAGTAPIGLIDTSGNIKRAIVERDTGKVKKTAPPPAALVRRANKKPPTPSQLKLVATAAAIDDREVSGKDTAFMHAIMCQVGLPRARVAGTEFERMCGGAALNVSAGKIWDGQAFVQQPIPYGPMPRLMLAWMNTYAVINKSPEIAVGDSASDFLRMLGKKASGGKTGTYTTFRKQIQALSAARMTIGFNANGKAYTYDGKPINKFEAWMHNTGEQMALWPGVVTFSDEYFKTLCSHAVPLNFHDYKALSGSALAMDTYTMLADRLHRIEGRPVLLYWAKLREQFGQEYTGKEADKDFKKKFLIALNKVLTVYENANVKQVTGGLLLMPSPPPIPYRPK